MAESAAQKWKRRYRRALAQYKREKREHPGTHNTLLWRRKTQRYLRAYRKAQRPEKVSAAGARFIADFEGGQSSDGLFHPYLDPVGVWTIGYGHTQGVGGRTKPLTRAEALALLRRDLDETYTPPVVRALKASGIAWTQPMLDATVSFVYNLGPGVLGPSYTFGRRLRDGNRKGAANSMLLYDKGGGRRLPGLTRRRRAEHKLFLK